MKRYFTHRELSASPQRKLALAQLSAFILQQRPSHPLRVAIDGVDAAGKTRLAAFDHRLDAPVESKPLDPGDATELEQRYTTRYIPGQKIFLQEARPDELSSVIWDGNNLDQPRWVIRLDPA